MKRFFVTLFIILFFAVFFVFSSGNVFAQRFAACDLCGYCPPNAAPQSWESCRSCIYPSASTDPESKDTLVITENKAPTPQPGNMYTMVGCIQTGTGNFSEGTGTGNIVQFFISRVLFPITGAIAFLYLIYGSFTIITSQADPERLNHGKRLVMGAIIGLIFSILAVFLVNLIATGILQIPGFGS